MSLNRWISRLIIAPTALILSSSINIPEAQAEPNCRCDNEWCYVRQGGSWNPVSRGSMANGFAAVCQDAWNKHYNRGSGGSGGMSRSCFERFNSCMDRCDRLHYSQVPNCISRCDRVRQSCQSKKPSDQVALAGQKQDCE